MEAVSTRDLAETEVLFPRGIDYWSGELSGMALTLHPPSAKLIVQAEKHP